MCLTYGAEKCLEYLVDQQADITTPSIVGRSVAAEFESAPLSDRLKARIRAALTVLEAEPKRSLSDAPER